MREELLLQSCHVGHISLFEFVMTSLTLVASSAAIVVLAWFLTTSAIEVLVLLATRSLLLITLAAATLIVGGSCRISICALSLTVALRLVLETLVTTLLLILVSATLSTGSTSLVGHPWLIVMLN